MHSIKLLIPDLPTADALLPWLQRIDNIRCYTNFGPLVCELEQRLGEQWPTSETADIYPNNTLEPVQLEPLQVVTLNTGTAPIELAIASLKLKPNSEVLLPAFTFPATATAILRNGLTPVFTDVAVDNWQLTPAIARHAVAQRAIALVIPVATFGCPLHAAEWDTFTKETGIPVLMDAAAAFGNQAIGQHVHTSFSLHATKPFGIGEGGLLVTRNADLANQVRQLSNFGFDDGLVRHAGTNAKLSEYAAAIALAQWARRDQLRQHRQQQLAIYRAALAQLPKVIMQSGFEGRSIPASLVVKLPCPAENIAQQLADSGIETRRWYCPPLHLHTAFSACTIVGPRHIPELPVTEQLAGYTLGLPWHNFLTEEDILRTVARLGSALESSI